MASDEEYAQLKLQTYSERKCGQDIVSRARSSGQHKMSKNHTTNELHHQRAGAWSGVVRLAWSWKCWHKIGIR